jgi:hypothetical protein
MEAADLVLMPWIEARRTLGSRPVAFRLLAPPYAAAGGGALRVLRVRSGERVEPTAPVEVVCGYERYRRL